MKTKYSIPRLPVDMFTFEAWRLGSNLHILIGESLRIYNIKDHADVIRKHAIGYLEGEKLQIRPKTDEFAVGFIFDDEFGWTHFVKEEFEEVFKC